MSHWRRVAKAVVLVPTTDLAHQWRAEIERALDLRVGLLGDGGTDSLFDCDVLVTVVHSAAGQVPEQVRLARGTRPVLLVADECHRYGADTFSGALDAPYHATLGLTATPERGYDSGMEQHVFPKVGEVVFEYAYEDAVSEGVIVDFDCAFVGLDFRPRERTAYDELSDRIVSTKQGLMFAHPELEITGSEFFPRVTALARDEDPTALAFLSAVAKRRHVLLYARARSDFIAWLVDRTAWGGKAILFHERIDQCDELVEILAQAGIAAVSHHSELTSSARRRALDSFASGETRAIVAPKTLDEGIDVPDADLAIIVAGSTVKRQRIQRIGRVLRRAEGKPRARVILLYVRGSREDPNQLGASDGFAEAMEKIDRAVWFNWPRQGERLLAHLRGEIVQRADRPPRGERPASHRPAAAELTHPEELPPTEGQLLDLAQRGYRGEQPISQAAADRVLVGLPRSRRRPRVGAPAHRSATPPTFAQILQAIPAGRRLSDERRAAHVAGLRRDLRARIEAELDRIRAMPGEKQKQALVMLQARRDRVQAGLEALDP